MLKLSRRSVVTAIALAVPVMFVLFGMTALAQSTDSTPSLGASPGAGTSGAALPGDPDKGAQVYANDCTGCHGANLEGGVGAKLNPIAGGPKNLDPAYLIDTISNGENGKLGIGSMPAKGGHPELTDDDVKNLAAFIIKSNQGKATLSAQDLARSTVLWVAFGIICLTVVTWILARYNMRWIARRAASRRG